jgi:hypothetical protein
MKTKFILPAGLALTLPAFLLFGLPGKTPVAPSLPDPFPGKMTGCTSTGMIRHAK